VIELLAEHLSQWSCSIAFPELAHLPLLHLRKFGKQCKVERFRTSSRALADALERNMAFVSQRRQQVDFSPKDTAQVNTFLQTESAAHQVRRRSDPALLAHVMCLCKEFLLNILLNLGLSSCTCTVICKQQQQQ
jgi:nucleolar complex protein 2